jgi:hypothetical protein
MGFVHLEGDSLGMAPDTIKLAGHHQRHRALGVPYRLRTWVEQSDPHVSNAGPARVIYGGPGGYPRSVLEGPSHSIHQAAEVI